MLVINCRFLTQKTTGVQRYAFEVVNLLSEHFLDKEIMYVLPKEENITENIKFGDNNLIRVGKFKGHLWEQIDLVKFLKKNNNPLLINFGGIGPIYYKNKVTYIHDLAFKYFPETFSYVFQKSYNYFVPISARNSKRVITVSNYVKSDIEKNYDIKNIEVVYAAQSRIFKNINLNKEKIILAVSSLDPRKNFERIIKAYLKLNTDYKLIFVGTENKSFSKLKLDNKLSSDKIIFTGYLSDDELINLYNKASIFIYASIFEGFGIPPLEAQACGCPCLVSNKTSLPEIYQNSVEYCDPFSINDISIKLDKLIKNKDLRMNLIEKGYKNIKRFSWEKSAEKLSTIIKKEL